MCLGMRAGGELPRQSLILRLQGLDLLARHGDGNAAALREGQLSRQHVEVCLGHTAGGKYRFPPHSITEIVFEP